MLTVLFLAVLADDSIDDTPDVVEPGAVFTQPDGMILTQPDGTVLTQFQTTPVVSPPDAPVALDASDVTNNSFQLNWSAVAGATGYRIDLYEGNLDVPLTLNLDVGNVTFYVTGSVLASDALHTYRIRAYNSGGTSGNSNVISATTFT